MLQQPAASFLIEILPAEIFVRARDSRKFKLDHAADGLKETILEVARMVRPEDGAAGVLANLREMAVIRDGAMRNMHLIRNSAATLPRKRFGHFVNRFALDVRSAAIRVPSHWLVLPAAVCTQTHKQFCARASQ